MSASDRCVLCGASAETSLHIWKDCSHALSLWNLLVPQQIWGEFREGELVPWLNFNIFGNRGENNTAGTLADFVHGSLVVTLEKAISEDSSLDPLHLAIKVRALASEVAMAFECPMRGVKPQVRIAWQPPEDGFVKLNTEGAACG
ncbi:RNA-directed DNA polymerase [Striga asiatica]|uniref:RNA-directed DNA polymerase n=1 Tax=Striga asiatica TaxID=4170 RepID=A0A5A7Q1S5_STRAF|nr:RNA-directed DNA polymerase [Striga asiatica]